MSNKSAIKSLEHAKNLKVLCIGDIMLDRFIYGEVQRISPEAPVPVIKRRRDTAMPGGAGNVARNLASLGMNVALIGVLGDDTAGEEFERQIHQSEGIFGDFVRIEDRPTTEKTRYVAGGQQLMRVDAEQSDAIDSETTAKIFELISTHVVDAKAIILSDYAKGVLVSPVIDMVLELGRVHDIPVIVDPKGRDLKRYGRAALIKPNAKELSAAVDMPTDSDSEVEAALKRALEVSDADAIVVTRAAKGMSSIQRNGSVQHFIGEARDVYDVSGAGDTSIAALAMGLSVGGSLASSVELAIAASGIAVGKAGTATVTAQELQAAFKLGTKGRASVHRNAEELSDQISFWRDDGLRIGFTNGCFDILHPGHLHLLEEARARCDRLIVGLNSDASVSRLKGPSRPINDEVARSRVLNGLSVVDAVVVFEEDTPAKLISEISPDLLVKGGDYSVETIVGADEVIRNGGEVHIVPLVEGQSTTAAIARASS